MVKILVVKYKHVNVKSLPYHCGMYDYFLHLYSSVYHWASYARSEKDSSVNMSILPFYGCKDCSYAQNYMTRSGGGKLFKAAI